jgi:hypothetical protein
MAQKHIHPQAIAFAEETTVCVPPADWTAATAIEFISCDLSGVKEALVADPTAERRAFRVGERARVKGIRNCTASLVLKLHGVGEETADTMQVENTYLARILKHCLGQAVRGYSTTIDGPGTTAIPIVASITGVVPGVMLAFEDVTSPTEQNEGILHFRRVLSVDAGTKAVVLSEALGFTPQDGDKVHACITGAFDDTYLVDAVAAGGTMQWYVKRETGNTDDDLLWTLEGSVASMKLDGLGRGALPTINLELQAANFRHGAADGLNNVALATPEGHAQLSMGTNVRMLISPSASNASVEVDQVSAALDIGMTRKPTLSHTERLNRFDGLSSYSYDPGASTMTVTVVGYTADWYAALAADSTWRLTLYQPGDGSGAGKAWCIHAPMARLIETPARTDVDMVHGVSLKFQLCESDDATPASNQNLEMSRLLIALA